jgi:hypothetical protein
MAKLMCAKCGGKVKMANGGTTPKKVLAKAPVNMYGIPQENMGTSSQYGFGRKGGSTNRLPKAQLGAIVKGIKSISKAVKPAAKIAKPVKKAKPKIIDFRTTQTKDLVKNAYQNIDARSKMKQQLQEIEKMRKLKYPNGDPVFKSIFNIKKP